MRLTDDPIRPDSVSRAACALERTSQHRSPTPVRPRRQPRPRCGICLNCCRRAFNILRQAMGSWAGRRNITAATRMPGHGHVPRSGQTGSRRRYQHAPVMRSHSDMLDQALLSSSHPTTVDSYGTVRAVTGDSVPRYPQSSRHVEKTFTRHVPHKLTFVPNCVGNPGSTFSNGATDAAGR